MLSLYHGACVEDVCVNVNMEIFIISADWIIIFNSFKSQVKIWRSLLCIIRKMFLFTLKYYMEISLETMNNIPCLAIM
jgi:hypothetical protein